MSGLLSLNEHLAHVSKQSVTTVNVFMCLLFNIPLGFIYCKLFHPKRVSPDIRHFAGLILGLGIGWVCIKREIYIIIAITLLCYGLNYSIHPAIVHKVVFGVSFSILLVAQIIHMVQSYGEDNYDYTAIFMLLVQRITYFAFSYHDGAGRDKKELNEWQQKQCFKTFPSMLEYFGYMFHFSSFLVGPNYTFREYIDFIEGKDIERVSADSKGHNREPSPTKYLNNKVWFFLLSFLGMLLFAPRFPIKRNGDPSFINSTPFLLRCLYAWLSIAFTRFKYYTAFILGEMAVVSSGMGFTGYDENGDALWENANSVNLLRVEIPTSLKMVADNWNIATAKWLRRIVHDRVPYQKAAFTVTMSMLWHGLYPGYFMIGSSCFLLNEVSKKARRVYGHVYQDLSPIGQKWLLALQIFINVVLVTYCTIPFPLLRFDLTMQFWSSMYFFGHIVCGLGLVVLHMCRKPKPEVKESHDSPEETKSSYNNNAAHRRKINSNKLS